MSFKLIGVKANESIRLETAKGNPIDNYKVYELSQYERNQFADYTSDKYRLTKFRCSPSPEYNCHGMTFASRRTNIESAKDIRTILQDDGYKRIEIRQTEVGDLVLYVNPNNNDIIHSGTLVSCEHPLNDIPVIKVISKWGKYREAIHPLSESGYKDYVLEFYRLTHEQYEL